MRKGLSIVLLLCLFFGLSACRDRGDSAEILGVDNVTLTVGDAFNPLTGITAIDARDGDITSRITVSGTVNMNVAGTYTLTYRVTGSDGNEISVTRTVTVLTEDGCGPNQRKVDGVCVDIEPSEIVIMHGATYEIDPFHPNFSGTQQLQRQNRQREVEELYNVTIRYRSYPDNAPWGPSRVTAIIQSSVSGNHLADIYWSVSDWIQQLARAEAIVPVDQYMNTIGVNVHADYRAVGTFKDNVYGFSSGMLTADSGLYYNADLVKSLGVANPTQLFLDGEWTWSRFETWATQVQAILDEDEFAIGGMPSYYVENMVPLNGGRLINMTLGRVAFHQAPALETYTFLKSLVEKDLWETAPSYDAGSPSWQAGKVAIHPGQLWFVTADNRWGGLNFELGFVPYPRADDFIGDHASPVSGVALYHLASGMTPEREELVFRVWNELQLWRTEQELRDEFELTLLTRFDEEIYVEAYMMIFDKIYLEIINAIGINPYTPDIGFRGQINAAIRLPDRDPRTVVDSIRPIYQAALDDYLE